MFPNLRCFVSALLIVSSFAWASQANAEVSWKRSPQQVVDAARVSRKPILVFVTAKWCHYCQLMKQETWSDSKLSAAINENFETLVLDGDQDKAIVQDLDLRGYPATLIFNADGEFITKKDGFMPPDVAASWMGSVLRR